MNHRTDLGSIVESRRVLVHRLSGASRAGIEGANHADVQVGI